VIKRGEITINRERFEVRVRGETLDLTFKEFELIAYLAQRPGRVCSRNALLSEVWGYDFFGGTRTVDVHVRRLRAKLAHEAHMIETVRNVGYRFAG
jgi:DNA-binding response OmpR family regulator